MMAALSMNLSASSSFLDCSPVIPRTIKIKSGMNKIKQMYSNENKKIKEGDKIDAIVTASQYNKKKFSCIGCLA